MSLGTSQIPIEDRKRLLFRDFTTKRSADGIAVGMTFTLDGQPETAENRCWFGVAIVDTKPDVAMIGAAMLLLQRKFEAFVAGKEDT